MSEMFGEDELSDYICPACGFASPTGIHRCEPGRMTAPETAPASAALVDNLRDALDDCADYCRDDMKINALVMYGEEALAALTRAEAEAKALTDEVFAARDVVRALHESNKALRELAPPKYLLDAVNALIRAAYAAATERGSSSANTLLGGASNAEAYCAPMTPPARRPGREHFTRYYPRPCRLG